MFSTYYVFPIMWCIKTTKCLGAIHIYTYALALLSFSVSIIVAIYYYYNIWQRKTFSIKPWLPVKLVYLYINILAYNKIKSGISYSLKGYCFWSRYMYLLIIFFGYEITSAWPGQLSMKHDFSFFMSFAFTIYFKVSETCSKTLNWRLQ